jgi:hypothetical protein
MHRPGYSPAPGCPHRRRAAGDEADDRSRWRKRARVGRRTGLLLIVPSERPHCLGGDDRIQAGSGSSGTAGARRNFLPVLAQPPPALDQPLAAIARDALRPRGPLGVQRLLGLAEHLATITARAQPLGQLIAARLAEQLVLGGVDARGLLEDLPGDLLIGARRVMRGRRGDLRAVDRDDADVHQSAARAQRQDLTEQLGDRRLVADAEARDRRVIRRPVGGDHAEGDVVMTAPLDRARRAHTDRVGVDEQRDHHLRIVRRATPPVVALARVERAQVHLRSAVASSTNHARCSSGSHSRRLGGNTAPAPITRDEVLRHHRMALTAADRPGLCDTLRDWCTACTYRRKTAVVTPSSGSIASATAVLNASSDSSEARTSEGFMLAIARNSRASIPSSDGRAPGMRRSRSARRASSADGRLSRRNLNSTPIQSPENPMAIGLDVSGSALSPAISSRWDMSQFRTTGAPLDRG